MNSHRPQESIGNFYDRIAEFYDSHLTEADRKVRETISGLFKQNVSSGRVLDFGGGTGLDLNWLARGYDKVFFLEPSVNMRTIAKRVSLDQRNVYFIETNTRVSDWQQDHLPFAEKIDGVLANFAVLNCIENLDAFFENTARVCNENCHLVAVILDPRPATLFKKYSLLASLRIAFRKKLTVLNKHNEVFHETYIHTLRSIRHSSQRYFELISCQPLACSDFIAVILVKK